MEDNPFTMMIKNIRDDNKAQMPILFRYGKVITTNPLTIDVAGVIQKESVFLKNSLLTLFNQDDLLLLLPIEDEQRYIIICKVVDT